MSVLCPIATFSEGSPPCVTNLSQRKPALLGLMDGLILLIGEGFDSEDRFELLVDYRLRLQPEVAIIWIGRVPVPVSAIGTGAGGFVGVRTPAAEIAGPYQQLAGESACPTLAGVYCGR